MTDFLDQQFAWAAQQRQQLGPNSTMTLAIQIATNQVLPINNVSYAEGTLTYKPGPGIATPHIFTGDNIPRFQSGNRYAPSSPPPLFGAPFDSHHTDLLTVTITPPSQLQPVISATPPPGYTITIKVGTKTMQFSPSADPNSHVLHGSVNYDNGNPAFVTISLCNRLAQIPPS